MIFQNSSARKKHQEYPQSDCWIGHSERCIRCFQNKAKDNFKIKMLYPYVRIVITFKLSKLSKNFSLVSDLGNNMNIACVYLVLKNHLLVFKKWWTYDISSETPHGLQKLHLNF